MSPFLAEGLLLLGGLAALYFGAEWVVRGGVRLADAFGVSSMVVGLTVVSVGTSAPELVVGVTASLRDAGELAVGNVLGSNLANIGLILGTAALVRPIQVSAVAVRREIPVMVAITALLFPVVWNLQIGRLEGGVLLLVLMAYLALLFWSPTDPGTDPVVGEAMDEVAGETEEEGRWEEDPGTARSFVLMLTGLAALTLGAHATVESALFFARAFGVPELIVGLTVVAIGTSLPELATSVVAAFREEADLAVGNVIGSNVFNLAGILGAAALVHPLDVPRSVPGLDLPAVLVFSLLLLPVTWPGFRIERWGGGILVAGYFAAAGVILM